MLRGVICFIFWNYFIIFTFGHKIYVSLNEYRNIRNQLSTGSLCENKLFLLVNRHDICDPQFRISVCTPLNCKVVQAVIDSYKDKSFIRFGTALQNHRNILVVFIARIPKIFHVKVTVYDVDRLFFFGRSQLIEEFNLYLNTSRLQLPRQCIASCNDSQFDSMQIYDLAPRFLSRHEISLSIKFRYECESGYYGRFCDIHCEPSDNSDEGHYGCELSTGRKICMKGWTGIKCNQMDVCVFKNQCSDYSTCVASYENGISTRIKCRCPHYLKGLHCEEPVESCSLMEQTTVHGEPCRNGAQCAVLNRTNATHPSIKCICSPHWYGSLCHMKRYNFGAYYPFPYSNCRIGTTLKVIKTPQVKQLCVCQNGYGGALCEFSVKFPRGYNESSFGEQILEEFVDRSKGVSYSRVSAQMENPSFYLNFSIMIISFLFAIILIGYMVKTDRCYGKCWKNIVAKTIAYDISAKTYAKSDSVAFQNQLKVHSKPNSLLNRSSIQEDSQSIYSELDDVCDFHPLNMTAIY